MIDNALIRRLQPRALIAHFRQLCEQHSKEQITTHLLYSIESGSIPAPTGEAWLVFAKSPSCLWRAANQEFSILTRRAALREMARMLRTPGQLERVRLAVGTDFDLGALFCKLSVQHVAFFVKSLATTRFGPIPTELSAEIEALLDKLIPFAASGSLGVDPRPLNKIYARLLPACSIEYVKRAFAAWGSDLVETLPYKALCTRHVAAWQEGAEQGFLHGEFHWSNWEVDMEAELMQTLPPTRSSDGDLSTPMAFSMRLLRQLGGSGDAKKFRPSSKDVMDRLVTPLARRLLKRRWSSTRRAELTLEIVQLSFAYIEGCDNVPLVDARCHITFKEKGLPMLVLSAWRRDQATFNDALLTLLRWANARRVSLMDYERAFKLLPAPLRMAFLRLFLQSIDDEVTDTQDAITRNSHKVQRWPINIFYYLPRSNALQLLRHVLRVKGGKCIQSERQSSYRSRWFLQKFQYEGSRISTTIDLVPTKYEDDVLLAFLEKGEPGALERATRTVRNHRHRSAASRDPEDRLSEARCAVLASGASGSIALFDETLRWSQRFIRDPLAVRSLWATTTLASVEAVDLLTGLPIACNLTQESIRQLAGKGDPSRTAFAREFLARNVPRANDVLRYCVQLASDMIDEPTFSKSNCSALCSFYLTVIYSRLAKAGELQEDFGLLDDDMRDLLWKPTIDLALTLEDRLAQPYHRVLVERDMRLRVDPVCDPNREKARSPEMPPASIEFLNQLMTERDSAWRKRRIAEQPDLLDVRAPFTRGLPVQQMLSFSFHNDVQAWISDRPPPYVMKRAKDIVFMEQELAVAPLPDSKTVRMAMASFVDDYESCLITYIRGQPFADQKAAAVEAWKHLMGPLTNGRMGEEESWTTWRPVFQRCMPWFKPPSTEHRIEQQHWHPRVPSDVGPEESAEWNPSAVTPKPRESRTLKSQTFDIFLQPDTWMMSSSTDPDGRLVDPSCKSVAFRPQYIWTGMDYRDTVPANLHFEQRDREGLIASALLYVDAHGPDHARILKRPFPSPADMRYPSLYLDETFVEDKCFSEPAARSLLYKFLRYVPPSLVAELTKNPLDSLLRTSGSFKEVSSLEQYTFRNISLLCQSDNPALAISYAIRAVIERPSASSWHRLVLNSRYLRTLSHTQARDVIDQFTQGVLGKLEEQKRQLENLAPTEVVDQPPVIKISTVKQLAQLFRDASFVSTDYAIDILGRLVRDSAHVDTQIAVLQSLLEALYNCRTEASRAITEKILDALEITIPIVGGINESKPMTEQRWLDAETKLELPRVTLLGSGEDLPPMMSIILDAPAKLVEKMSIVTQQDFIRRIVVPILSQSCANNARWMRIFGRKWHVQDLVRKLPTYPVFPAALDKICSQGLAYVPVWIVRLFHERMMRAISPSSELQEMKRVLEKDRELSSTQDGHWIEHHTVSRPTPMFRLAQELRTKWVPTGTEASDDASSNDNAGATLPFIQRLVEEQAWHYIHALSEPYTSHSSISQSVPGPRPSLDYLVPFDRYTSQADLQAWTENCLPVIRRVLLRINDLRSSELWQRDPNRFPHILPDTWKLELWLIPHPSISLPSSKDVASDNSVVQSMTADQKAQQHENEKQQRLAVFAAGLESMIRRLGSSHEPYHARLGALIEHARIVLKHVPEDALTVGLLLAGLESSSSPPLFPSPSSPKPHSTNAEKETKEEQRSTTPPASLSHTLQILVADALLRHALAEASPEGHRSFDQTATGRMLLTLSGVGDGDGAQWTGSMNRRQREVQLGVERFRRRWRQSPDEFLRGVGEGRVSWENV